MHLGERSPKDSPLSVVVYEIQMLNHAATYLVPEILDRRDHVANAWQEVYLLHYRNLIEFFTKRKPRLRAAGAHVEDAADDMAYLAPLTWAAQDIPVTELMPAVERADSLYKKHWAPISRFLQHCTDWRHALPKVWNYPAMHAEIGTVLNEMFELMKRRSIAVPPDMP